MQSQHRAGSQGAPVSHRPGGRTPGSRSAPGPAPHPCRYLQHFAVHHGADGAGAEAGGEAFKESCSPVHLYDVLGWGQRGPSAPGGPHGGTGSAPGRPHQGGLTVREEAGQLIHLAAEDVPP